MRFRDDSRAQAIQIGAVILFGFVVISTSVYQATVVPQQNMEVEFAHNDRVQDQLGTLRAGILRTAATGTSHPASVALGTSYPSRTLFANPPPPSGVLRTESRSGVVVDDAEAVRSETADFWDGTSRSFDTRALVYRPVYNEYDDAPSTVYGSSVLYNRFASTNLTLSNQSLVDGRRITVVTLDGSLSESGTRSVSVDPRPVSAPPTEVAVTNRVGGQVTLAVPTRLTEDRWRELLAGELSGGSNDGKHVVSLDCANEAPAPCGILTLTLEAGVTYDLRLAKVGIGSGAADEPAVYITDVEGNSTSVPEDGCQKVVAEVRDRYNNPVSGATVTAELGDASADGGETLARSCPLTGGLGTLKTVLTATTDSDGQATVVYKAPDDVDAHQSIDVEARVDGGVPGIQDREQAVFHLTVLNADGSGSGQDGGGGGGPGGGPGGS